MNRSEEIIDKLIDLNEIYSDMELLLGIGTFLSYGFSQSEKPEELCKSFCESLTSKTKRAVELTKNRQEIKKKND